MKFRKKPVVVEAIQAGNNWSELEAFTGKAICMDVESGQLVIPTLEGNMKVAHRDWIIKGIKGEFYPCKPDIFEMTYEKVTE